MGAEPQSQPQGIESWLRGARWPLDGSVTPQSALEGAWKWTGELS